MRIRVSLTVPKEILSTKAVRDALAETQRKKTGPEVKKLFQQTAEGFRKRPTWNMHLWQNWNEVGVRIQSGTSESAEIYALVNAGSPPHEIRPIHPDGMLRFRSGYTPATRPRYLHSQLYKRSGPYLRAKVVNHPGFKAREFDQEIAEQYTPTFREDMEDALNRVAHQS